MLQTGERQVAPTLDGIRRDHVARYEFARDLIGRTGTRKVLDLACGIGYGSAILADAGYEVVGIDYSREVIEYGREHYYAPGRRMQLLHANAQTLYYQPNLYDAAVCFETIEHLADPLPMLTGLRHTARKLIASVPNESVFPYHKNIAFHHRHYTRAEFAALLMKAGWCVAQWWGQAGPESEVEPQIEGRTLVAVCERAVYGLPLPQPTEKTHEAPATAQRATETHEAPGHVAIVGLGPSCTQFFELTRRLGGVSAYCDEVWGINAIGDVLRCDRVFHMDDMRVQEARAAAKPDSNIAAMVKWLKTHPGPVITSIPREGYPSHVAFPLEAVLNGGYDSNGGAPYFNSTGAYAIAYAVHIGVKQISLFGLDYTLPDSHKAEKGRACCEFWLGIAAARGIGITLTDGTSMLDACEPDEARLYGYDCVDITLRDQDDGRVRVIMKDRDRIPTADEIEARYSHRQHVNPLMRK